MSGNIGGRHFWAALTEEVDERLRLERHCAEMAESLFQSRALGPRCCGSDSCGSLPDEVQWARTRMSGLQSDVEYYRDFYNDGLRVIRNLRRLAGGLIVLSLLLAGGLVAALKLGGVL